MRFIALTGKEDVIEQYRQRRPGSTNIDLLSDLMTDYTFLFPSLRLAEAAHIAGSRTWVYQFDWAPPGRLFLPIKFQYDEAEYVWEGW